MQWSQGMKYASAIQLKNNILAQRKLSAAAHRAIRIGASVAGTVSATAIVAPATASMAVGVIGKKGDYRLAIRIQEQTSATHAIVDDIRRTAKGEVDVRIIGKVCIQQTPWHQGRNRPLRIGGSIGAVHTGASGTLGCFVTRDHEEDLILSNNHVLANENRSHLGTTTLQPGEFDGGLDPDDRVGELQKFIPLYEKKKNRLDCAVASLDEGIEYYYSHLEGLGELSGVRDTPLEDGEPVFKVGRTTGLTEGRVRAIEVDKLTVEFEIGDLQFFGQIEIEPAGSEPFSLAGDSGSLIVDRRRRAVGLLFAGNDVDRTYANDIREVLAALNVELVF